MGKNLTGQKWSEKTFLSPHLESPKDNATKTGEDTSGMQLYHHAKFPADRWHRRRDICDHTTKSYLRFNIRQNACTSITFAGYISN